jgi:glycosyltransferase involved in cell wall biosynthesis
MTVLGRVQPRVLVCHGGRQHSHQLAMALAGRGMLAKYVTGLPTRRDAGDWVGSRWLRRVTEAYAVPIEPALVKHVYITPVVRMATRVLGAKWSYTAGQLADGLFDRWVSGIVRELRPNVVVAYENGALCTFRRAKELGVTTVLDAASIHHRWQDRYFRPTESAAAHRRSKRRKSAEIALADQILVVSNFARESYLDAGVPPERVHTMPLGVDSSRFRPDFRRMKARIATDGGLRFVYVGNESRLKGIEILRAAVSRLRAAGERLTTTLIGVSGDPPGIESSDGIVRVSWMSHDRLAAELPQHDVLVLPSLFDSFGMVVAEAMACGLPAIVTENVGAKEMITPGVNGLIIAAGDAVALADAMRWFITNKGTLYQMSHAATESAKWYDWANYRRRVTDFLASTSFTGSFSNRE